MGTTGKNADKRTPEQRSNGVAQNARPKGAQDTTFSQPALRLVKKMKELLVQKIK